MRDFSSYERECLSALFASSDWLDMFVFHEKYLLSPGQVASFMRRFEEGSVIEAQGGRARLTEFGRRWVLANRAVIFLVSNRVWAEAPQIMVEAARINPFEPYLPDLKRLQERFFLT